MPRTLSPMALRIYVQGGKQAENDVNSFANTFGAVEGKADNAGKKVDAVVSKARQLGMAGREARAMQAGLDSTAQAATKAAENLNDVNEGAEKTKRSIFEMAREARRSINDFKQLGQEALKTAQGAAKVWDVYKALRSGKPVSIFSAVVPEKLQKQIAGGLLAKSAGEFLALGRMVGPAMEKEARLRAIENFTGSKGASQAIYGQTDELASKSAFGLDELVLAAKTLTKDRQFSERLLKAADNLASANKDEGVAPQDIARVFGRLRSQDWGEAFERLRDFGISRPDLEAKGLTFDNSNSYEDKTVEGATKAIDAVARIIEERFGRTSEILATTTLEGSVTNLGDATGRAATSIAEHYIPALNMGANALGAAAKWFAELPEPVHKLIAWIAALDAAASGAAGAAILGLIIWGKIKFTLWAVRTAVVALNWALGFAGTSVRGLAVSLVTRLIPSMFAAGTSTLVMAGVLGLLAIAVAGAIYVLKMYIDEMGRATATVEDARSAQQIRQDEQSIGDIQKSVSDSSKLSKRDRYAVLKAAVDKAAEIGDADAGLSLNTQLAALRKELKAAGLPTGNAARKAETAEGQALVDAIRSKTGNKVDRNRGIDLGNGEKGNPLDLLSSKQAEWAKMFQAKGGGPKIGPGGSLPWGMGSSGQISRGEAEQELFEKQSPRVQAAMMKVEQLMADVEQLTSEKNSTDDKDLKKALGEKIAAKRRLLVAARRELAAVKKLATGQERIARSTEKAEDKVGDIEFEIKKDSLEGRYAGKISDTERELRSAKDIGDSAAIKRLTFALAHENARKQLELDLLEADREKDARIRIALRKRAQNSYRLAENAGALEARNAALDAEKERQDVARRGDVDAGKAIRQNETDARIAPLEEALGEAKDAADLKFIRSLTIQIETLKAESEFSDAMAEATLEDNKEKRKQLERLALIRRTGALAKALVAGNKAVRDASKSDANSDKGAREALARMRAATRGENPMGLNPLRPGGMLDGVPSLSRYGDMDMVKRDRTIRVKQMSSRQQGDGKYKMIFEGELDLPQFSDLEVN